MASFFDSLRYQPYREKSSDVSGVESPLIEPAISSGDRKFNIVGWRELLDPFISDPFFEDENRNKAENSKKSTGSPGTVEKQVGSDENRSVSIQTAGFMALAAILASYIIFRKVK